MLPAHSGDAECAGSALFMECAVYGTRVNRCPPFLLLALWPAWMLAADPWAASEPDPCLLVGTLSCASASCHGRPEPASRPLLPEGAFGERSDQEHRRDSTSPRPPGPARQAGPTSGTATINQQEYLHFLAGDPHAEAARRMTEPRYREVLRRASQYDPAAATRCAPCHDPLGHASESSHQPLGRGIGCESCHGAARDWLAVHYEQDVSRERLVKLGLIDTRQVLARAGVCASCHVGSPGRDVNHDLLAAGHPPLLFELASHQALIERKHWDDTARREREPNYEVQLWAAGQIASADAALALLAARADQASKSGPWPEFAESDCRSCHRPLRAESGSSSGLPAWQSWNTAGISPLGSLDVLRHEMQRSLVPQAAQVAGLAAAARTDLRQSVRLSPEGVLLCANGRPLDAAAVLERLDSAQPPNFDRACQELAALLAAGRSLGAPSDLARLRRIAAELRRDAPITEIAARLAAARREISDNLPARQP